MDDSGREALRALEELPPGPVADTIEARLREALDNPPAARLPCGLRLLSPDPIPDVLVGTKEGEEGR